MSSRRVRLRDSDSNENVDFGLERGGSVPTGRRLQGDEKNIVILFLLYLLQGIPLGLMQAIPIILTNTGISYTQQAQFSLVNWPFSLKLLWAPIVDSLYFSKMGKRKSWLVPIQYLIAVVMLFLSSNVDNYLAVDGRTEPNMLALVASFFFLNFLAATQDIAVDGWALTMLRRENVGYASTCNSVGQTAGYLFGFVAFIALESASFCNTYIRSEPEAYGLVTLPGYLQFWGWVFLVATTLTWLLKSELPPTPEDEPLNVRESYETLYKITCLRPIRQLAIVLLTAKIAFSACDALTGLKLIEAGVAKEKMALLAVPLVPLQILLPLFLSKKTAGPYPMNVYLKAYPFRLGFSLVIALFVWLTPSFIDNGVVPTYYYVLLFGIYGLHQITLYSMFVASMAFFAKISDPSIGGTYMTLVNTLANLGGNWPSTLSLWVVESLSLKACSTDSYNTCWNQTAVEACSEIKGSCEVTVDGYYVETIICTIFGFFWLLWGRGAINRLQSHSLRSYAVASRDR